jgi:hypothetical protein
MREVESIALHSLMTVNVPFISLKNFKISGGEVSKKNALPAWILK